MVDPFAIFCILHSAPNQLFWTHIITHMKWIWMRQDEIEEPKAEVVQEENPKASVVGWFQRSNSLTTSGLELKTGLVRAVQCPFN